ncbi:hypothetical protein [Caballeronia ptereochthonis]|uniref:Uncharacterized protein n=1 Tax=Caballeronia ptereochthonis TaxID=1777144 RepID=A0A157ZLM4_9BURK|nr:hypothetical protein [Caballeronia ptereochthonis]SAK46359.1 hypothetical protein AWB83_00710 [Caballeronia ptereochthonis]
MTDADLNQFFASQLANLKPEVQGFIPTQLDANCESYLQDVFEPAPVVSQDDMITSLVGIWKREGLDSLAALEPEFRRIAKALRATDQETQQVSNFIYAMY